MALAGNGLMGMSPARPGDDVGDGVGGNPDQAEEQVADFGDAERDAARLLAGAPFYRPTAKAARARVR